MRRKPVLYSAVKNMKRFICVLLVAFAVTALFSCSGGFGRFLSDLSSAAEKGDLDALLAMTDPDVAAGASELCKTTDDLVILLPFYNGLISTSETHISIELKYKSKTESPDGSVFVFCDAYIGVSGTAGKQQRLICIETVKRDGKTYIRDIF